MKWIGNQETDRGDYLGGGDASINTFSSDPTNSLIRESFQNSVDQWSDKSKPVNIKIKYHIISKKDLPDYENLNVILNQMKSLVIQRKDKNSIDVFNNIFKDLNGSKIKILEISDYNTKGAPGKDIIKQNEKHPITNWNALSRAEGYSVKPDNSAIGAYGIGKNALVNISNMRSVLYSTLAEGEK